MSMDNELKPGLFTGTDIDGKYRIVSVLGQGGMAQSIVLFIHN